MTGFVALMMLMGRISIDMVVLSILVCLVCLDDDDDDDDDDDLGGQSSP
jgi:hypothetical protein